MTSSSLLVCRLYRSILKASKPFCDKNSLTQAKVLTCLLHRTGREDESWASFLRETSDDDNEYSSDEDEQMKEPQRVLFRNLLREVVAGSSIRQMQWPVSVDVSLLDSVIRREFRGSSESKSAQHPLATRQALAFMTLAALNQKLAWYEALRAKAPLVRPQQGAAYVSPLPLSPPSSYLRPGAYLIAHPHMTGYFRRTVISILDHKAEHDSPAGSYGTYGLIVNRTRLSPQTHKGLTLEEVLRPLPHDLVTSFGGSTVREGGPVHMSLQMLHSLTPDQEELRIGGSPISMIGSDKGDDQQADQSTVTSAQRSDRAIYYKGDVLTAANAVLSGRLDREDVSFFVGASAWQPGQLDSEVERGFWMPVSGPPEIAHSGSCEHDYVTPEGEARPLADLWLSMLSACGPAEAELAHLMSVDDGESELGMACDDDDDYDY
ncbi:hypothetical protein MPSEU_000228800 [Mayamaea pseudoterrestris]|nr:hypothetical protein MPSEU_000228800 [Mayamaea pseudoterrestris]